MLLKRQLWVLYVINAIAVASTSYVHMQSSGWHDVVSVTAMHFLLGGVAFIVAALVSLWTPHWAYLVALIAAGISWLRYGLSFLGFFFQGFLPLFTPVGFLTYALPAILLGITTSYTYYGFVRTGQSLGPLQWLVSSKPSVLTKLGMLLLLITLGLITSFNTALARTKTHEMAWNIVQDISCPEMVEFAFVEAHGYKVLVCSNDLLNYLESSGSETVEVVFEVTYSLGVRGDFEIKQVGEWSSKLEAPPRMQFRCSNVELNCYGLQPGSPLTWRHRS